LATASPFDGGVTVPKVLGSRSTHFFSGLGGIDGGALKGGDRLPLGDAATGLKVGGADRPGVTSPRREREGGQVGPTREVRLRILPGPQVDLFEVSALDALERCEYVVSAQSDRMGYRLSGGVAPRRRTTDDMISDVTFVGALQIPASGDPILLMADRQTTGGYPQVAIVISADLPAAAQLAPGDRVCFERCTGPEALAALIAQEGRLLAIR
jgi:biotin-dependent carboxylase-like uncharacterized protein